MTKLRSSLDPDTLDEMIFINKNMKESDTYSAVAALEQNPLNQDPSTNGGTILDNADKNEATVAGHDQIKLEDRSQKKKIMFLHSKNKASRKGYKGEC